MYVGNNYYIMADDCENIGLLGIEELEMVFHLEAYSNFNKTIFNEITKYYGITIDKIYFNDEIEKALTILDCPDLYLISVLYDWDENESKISTNDFKFYLIDEYELDNIFKEKFNNIYLALNKYINEFYLLPYRSLLFYCQENGFIDTIAPNYYENYSDEEKKAIDIIFKYANDNDKKKY